MNYEARMRRFQEALAAQNIDLAFFPISADLQYLTGIPRDMPNFGNTMYHGGWIEGLFITASGRQMFTLTRMTATFHLDTSQHADVRVLAEPADPLVLVREVMQTLGIPTNARIAVGERTWAEALINLRVVLPDATFVSATDLLRRQRVTKDADELAVLRRAGEITEAAYADVRAKIQVGMTELDLMSEVDYQIRRHGGFAPSFTTAMYNMGPNHSVNFADREATWRIPLKPPVALLFDFGTAHEGYCYDFGRTVFLGDPDAEYQKVYRLIMDSQAAGIAALKSGVTTCEQADIAARRLIEEAGYGQYFMHRLGHGIGMDVHEPPFLNIGDHTILQTGMCFTVEPSILIRGVTGARVEDIIVVGPNGGEPLTSGYREMYAVSG
jgi:Xaa-Pro dipeptidase